MHRFSQLEQTSSPHREQGCGASGGSIGVDCVGTIGTGALCAGSTCACPGGQVDCGSACIDPASNRTYCGATGDCVAPAPGLPGTDCALDGRICVSSNCAVTCPGTQINCGGVCIEPSTDETYCGASGACTPGAGPLGTDGINCSTDVGTGALCTGSACACPSGQVACVGTCVDPNTNVTYCGASGNCTNVGGGNSDGTPCLSNQACLGGACLQLAQKVIFVTSTVYNGNLGAFGGGNGLLGGDALCAARATAGALTGSFKAWLSSDSVHARDRLTHFAGRYVLVDGTTVVANHWTDLVDRTILHAIDKTEFGAAPVGGTSNGFCLGNINAMTGTDGNGLLYGGNTCASWTTAAAGLNHALGDTGLTSQSWTELACWNPCNLTAPIYCLEQ
ncbi:MAG TPA: hypothetical protein VK540_00550 [Polyangiaceae bacterium]|nr:hypothetical protein [Polyangiaceae bacterium]